MPVPTSYTEDELAGYMHRRLRNVAASLGWTAPASYTDAVTDTLVAYGVADIGSVADVPRLLALADVEAWRAASAALAPKTDVSQEGRSNRRAMAYEHARDMLSDAITRALGFPAGDDSTSSAPGSGSRVTVRYVDRYDCR